MSSKSYTPGSVAQLLGTELATSGKETKLQAIFSKPAAESLGLKTHKKSVQHVAAGFSLNADGNASSDDDQRQKKRRHSALSRETGLHDVTVNNCQYINSHEGKSRPSLSAAVSTESSATERYLNRRTVNAKNALMRIETKTKTSRSISRDAAEQARTVFVGNVGLSVKKKALLRLFKHCGAIETLRMRSVPVADLKLPKKASVLTKQFHPSRNNANAYIVFADEAAVEKALSLNGTELERLHIRVDRASVKPKHHHDKSVFIGNLPFDIEEESVRQQFSVCGTITNVRVIRDRTTGAGKGFGYVTFMDPSSVTLALSLNNQMLNGRQLRVQRSTEKSQQRPSSRDLTPTPATATSASQLKSSNSVVYKVSKMRKQKDEHRSSLTEERLKRPSTLMKHKKAKEHKKKNMKKRSEMRRKRSLGQLLVKNNLDNIDTDSAAS